MDEVSRGFSASALVQRVMISVLTPVLLLEFTPSIMASPLFFPLPTLTIQLDNLIVFPFTVLAAPHSGPLSVSPSPSREPSVPLRPFTSHLLHVFPHWIRVMLLLCGGHGVMHMKMHMTSTGDLCRY